LWGYGENSRITRTTDIDELLDNVARKSHLLNLPESAPFLCASVFSELSDFELATINQYRVKFGLPVVDR
jgi:hypothetical protein